MPKTKKAAAGSRSKARISVVDRLKARMATLRTKGRNRLAKAREQTKAVRAKLKATRLELRAVTRSKRIGVKFVKSVSRAAAKFNAATIKSVKTTKPAKAISKGK